ncbi:UNVERIFIED_CONTAM: Ycf3-interacting protein 1, chloroplastic [Sesamum angustifolium]|uniref:Ycf3-interacting protein 1, chloroplastic n=1 Tax=Sesamum angustifolium TaxID=2727405 RepID=A0AAW2P8N1_9LAMI
MQIRLFWKLATASHENCESYLNPLFDSLIPFYISTLGGSTDTTWVLGIATYPIGTAYVMGVSGVLQPHPPPMAVSSLFYHRCPSLPLSYLPFSSTKAVRKHDSGRISGLVFVNKEDTSFTSTPLPTQNETEQAADPDPQDLEYVSQIKAVLERLRKNRDMLFNEPLSHIVQSHCMGNYCVVHKCITDA